MFFFSDRLHEGVFFFLNVCVRVCVFCFFLTVCVRVCVFCFF